MKIAVVGTGAMGPALTTRLLHQGEAEQIALTDTARAHALDLGHDRVPHLPMDQDEQQGLRAGTQALHATTGSLHP